MNAAVIRRICTPPAAGVLYPNQSIRAALRVASHRKCPADSALAIRPLDHSAEATLHRAIIGSPLVRSMAHELGDTDVIVHLQMSPSLPGNLGGTTRFVASRGGVRYLRTTISTLLAPEARAAMLGHELQHALEIAGSDAHDHESLRRW